ncbi:MULTISPECIES: BglG family transcription antiterminator LicT [unclassified Clostridium]|uniref:BglG family transcription antiterminator LicT n=1 Tax=unclassified Clostridium TaxID=2614128 RepID=UPI0013F0C222|nr:MULTISPECIES: PRD domain-containing protein [unclassified Clostridium]MBN1045167.1 PRD domain-containing protein [Clostridium botulinum]MBN1051884.1 PRD domain-containing protein [Clostridium botulinum]MBN1055102.1 PRD domain-containing protein [Clostridium botulinum]NFN93388.1 PRD domain-containing protein [Clostridium botulinum]NFR86447.1 PRD domain-containing protein [Clostridium botulinum]
MQIVKVMNNSLILARDENDKEIVVMGKGLGFKRKAGEELDTEKIEKIFVLKNETDTREYVKLIEETPSEYIEITNDIIGYANEKLGGKLNDQIFITLVDHISYALTRYEKNITIQNRLLWELKKFYPKEFEIGKYAVEYINNKLSVKLPEEEAGNIAFHVVNAQTDEAEMQNTMLTIRMLKDIFNIIQYNFGITIDKDSLNYSRFLTHLQFFVQRLLDDRMIESKENFIFEQMIKEYPKEVKCSRLIGDYVKKVLNKEISNEELLYLTIHIVRIVQK